MNLVARTLVAVFTLLGFCEAKATDGFHERSLEIGAGVLSHGLSRLAKDEAGEVGSLGASYYELKFQANFPVWNETTLSPLLLYMPDFLLPTKQPGGHARTTYTALGLPLVTSIAESWSVHYGPMFMMYTIKGEGGLTDMNNGTGTSTFAVPGRTERSQTVALMLGTSYAYGSARFALDFLGEGLLNSGKRTYSVMFSVTWLAFQY